MNVEWLMSPCGLKYNQWGTQNKWYNEEHCSRYYSWEKWQKVHQPQRSQNGCEQIKESERSGIVKVKEHKNIQSLNDYNAANEDEQQQLSYASLVLREEQLQSTTNGIKRSSWPTRAACVFSSISSTAESANAIATDFDDSSAFELNQSFTWLNQTVMRAQEQNLLNTFYYCHVSFNFKSCKSSRPAIPSVRPIKSDFL